MTDAPSGADEQSESPAPDASTEAEESKAPEQSRAADESSTRSAVEWPVEWSGVVESVVSTRGLGGSWNVAALGLYATDRTDEDDGDRAIGLGDRTESDDAATADESADDDESAGDGANRNVRAYTWGRTETRRNFASRGGGVVQFTRDPVDFVEAACSVREEDDPVLESADAWVRVEAERVETERIGSATEGEVERVEWALEPVETHVEREVVPTTSRAHAAIVEATVSASRLDVPEYDTRALRDRIRYFEGVVESTGGARDREAWERFEELVDWR